MWLRLIDGMLRWELQLIWGPFLVKAITDYNGFCHSFCKCNSLAKVPYDNYWFEWFRICSTKKLRRTNKWLLERSWNDGQSDTCRRSVRRNHFCTKKIILGSTSNHHHERAQDVAKRIPVKFELQISLLTKYKRPFCNCSVIVLCQLNEVILISTSRPNVNVKSKDGTYFIRNVFTIRG